MVFIFLKIKNCSILGPKKGSQAGLSNSNVHNRQGRIEKSEQLLPDQRIQFRLGSKSSLCIHCV